MNIISGILGFISLVLASVLGYLYMSYEFITPKELKKNYIESKNVNFYNLPYDIQNEYILKNNCPEPEVQIKEIVTEKIVYKPEIKEVIVEKPMIKEVIKNSTTKVVDFNTDSFKRFQCTKQRDGFYNASKRCLSNLNKFLDKNKDAKYFEVIGLVSTSEIKKLGLDELQINGLATKRIEDVVWETKEYLGKSNIFRANYHSISKANQKGFVLKAHY